MTTSQTTNIRITLETKKRIEKRAVYGDSHDTILNKILDKLEKLESKDAK